MASRFNFALVLAGFAAGKCVGWLARIVGAVNMSEHRLGRQTAMPIQPDPVGIEIAAAVVPGLTAGTADTGGAIAACAGIARCTAGGPAFNIVFSGPDESGPDGRAEVGFSADLMYRLGIAADFAGGRRFCLGF